MHAATQTLPLMAAGSLDRIDYASEAHALGTKELLHVLSGSVSMTVGDEGVELRAGDALWFSGHLPHTLANRKGRSARFSLSVYEPGVGA